MIHNWEFTTIGLSQRQARLLFLLIRLFVEWLGRGEDFAGGFALAQPETWEESALSPLIEFPLGSEQEGEDDE